MFDDAQLVIVRGLPGAGKSTLAREISLECRYVHLENDMYFEGPSGYAHDRKQMEHAKRRCLLAAKRGISGGGRVVVFNVFAKTSHMCGYLALSEQVVVIRPCRGSCLRLKTVPVSQSRASGTRQPRVTRRRGPHDEVVE
ncbi:AAA family ATPase [Pandoraea sp.]|uniref:AAA family ATPase n=1 Tax=Pandoraea sp. TaxID=1883445 RepID=UPI0035B2048B